MKHVIALVIFISACGGASVNNSANKSSNNNANMNSGPTVTEAKVTIDSADSVKIVGTYLTAPKPNSPALLLLHQWQSDRHSYDDFAKQMHEKGFAVLAIDGRGFGESTRKADGSTVSAGRADADVKAMLGDVDAAFNYLAKQQNVDAAKIGIVGASYGSSLAIIYAADHPNVAAVAMLSPGLNYFGNMPTAPAVEKYGDRPLCLLAGEDQDRESFAAVRRLNPMIGEYGRYEQTFYEAGGHGTDLLKVGADSRLGDFFSRKLQLK
jgi:dienelactone hydrolase